MPRLMEDDRESYCTGGNCAGHGFGDSEGKEGREMTTVRHCFRGVLPNLQHICWLLSNK